MSPKTQNNPLGWRPVAVFLWLMCAPIPHLSVAAAVETQAVKLRAHAWEVLQQKVHGEVEIKHARGVEAFMRAIAAAKGSDRDEWGLAGLLHDIDIEETGDDLSHHGLVAETTLQEIGVSQAVIRAIAAHDDHTRIARVSAMDHALFIADQMYWRIWETYHGKQGQPPSDELTNECAQIGMTVVQMKDIALRSVPKKYF